MTNEQVLDSGLEKARKMVRGYIVSRLEKACEMLVDDAVESYKSPIGPFTGNTITSYACGLFLDGSLAYYYSNAGKMKAPVRMKLRKGESAYLSPDYGGLHRQFTGRADTDGGFGERTSFEFLSKYRSKVKNGFEIVMCSGTEYSTYIETSMDGNVLTSTFQRAKGILQANFKPMGT